MYLPVIFYVLVFKLLSNICSLYHSDIFIAKEHCTPGKEQWSFLSGLPPTLYSQCSVLSS